MTHSYIYKSQQNRDAKSVCSFVRLLTVSFVSILATPFVVLISKSSLFSIPFLALCHVRLLYLGWSFAHFLHLIAIPRELGIKFSNLDFYSIRSDVCLETRQVSKSRESKRYETLTHRSNGIVKRRFGCLLARSEKSIHVAKKSKVICQEEARTDLLLPAGCISLWFFRQRRSCLLPLHFSNRFCFCSAPAYSRPSQISHFCSFGHDSTKSNSTVLKFQSRNSIDSFLDNFTAAYDSKQLIKPNFATTLSAFPPISCLSIPTTATTKNHRHISTTNKNNSICKNFQPNLVHNMASNQLYPTTRTMTFRPKSKENAEQRKNCLESKMSNKLCCLSVRASLS